MVAVDVGWTPGSWWSTQLLRPAASTTVWLGRIAALVVFTAVLVVRGGPVSAQNDALMVTQPTAAIAHGDFRRAEQLTGTADPPGYPLLASAFVAALRPVVGSPTWCSDRSLPPAVATGPQAAFYRKVLHLCSAQQPGRRGALPPWYRAQGAIAVLAWLVLLAGVELLVRAILGHRTVAEVVAALGLAVVPAASDTLIESFHPQDLLSFGLVCVALSQALRRRWLAVGVLFGVAATTHQLAVLAFFPVLALAPRWRDRAVTIAGALGAALVVVLPFLVSDPGGTWSALTGTYSEGAGVVTSGTVVGLLHVGEPLKLKLARDLPAVVSALLCATVWWRARHRLQVPSAFVGLVLACVGTRLVFEVSIQEYYFLAAAVLLLVLDLTAGRPPLWTVIWVVAMRYGVVELPSVTTFGWVAAAFLVGSLAAVATGLAPLLPRTTDEEPALTATARPMPS